MSSSEHLAVLRASVTRLSSIVEGFDAEHLRRRAYPTEWSVADVLSHLGSGAVIMQGRLEAGLGGIAFSDDMAQPIWDEWNAKSPDAQAADGLAADRALLERFEAVIDSARDVQFSFGPLTVDLEGLIDLRLNEHVLHTWDVEVVLDPNATVPAAAADVVVDNLDLMVRFTGKPTGTERDLHVHTVDPARDFMLALSTDAIAFGPHETNVANPVGADLELTADAFIRLVYGRFDADHATPVRGDIDVDELRRVFPVPSRVAGIESFALTPDESARSNITYEDGVLRIRATKMWQFGSAFQLVIGLVFAAFSASLGLSFAAVLFVVVGLGMALLGVCGLRGVIRCSPDDVSLRWFGTQDYAWPQANELRCETRVLWWGGRLWPPAEVVVMATGSGARVALWPTRDVREGGRGAPIPNAPKVARGLMQRYRDTFAPA